MYPRHYILDGEDLFEQGGIIDSLKGMKPLFEKMNIQFEISDHLEEYDTENQWVNHEISINGKKYIIFDKFEAHGWGEVAQRFADMINDQLQGSEEKIYLINCVNDGKVIFLTDEQFYLLSALIKDSNEKPLSVGDWCDVMLVQRAKI